MPVETRSESSHAVRPVSRPEHVPALDGVRGLAIAMVLALHILTSNLQTGDQLFDFLSAIRSSFWAGVDLFFALSGFLITGILLNSLHKNGYFRNFYARRALRIFPLYYGFLLTLICLTHPLHLHWQNKQYMLLTYTQNLGLFTHDLMGFTPARFINLNHFWSLAVEEQFYFVWPLVVFLVRDLRKLFLVTISVSAGALILRIILVFHGASPALVYEFTPCRIDALLLGASLAILYRSRFRQTVLRYAVPALLVFLTALLCLAFPLHGLDWKAPSVETAGFTLTALTGVALIAVALAGTSWIKSAFDNRVMRFLGKYSYGIYVFHYSFDAAFTAPLRRWANNTFHSKAVAVAFAAVPVVVATLLVAYASYHLYEKWFLNLKHRFESRPKPEPATLTPVRM